MEMAEIKEILISFDELLSERMKKYIHYRSMRNFVVHFDEIKSIKAQERIQSLLVEYIEEVQVNNFDFEGRGASLQLARKYLSNISGYYREYSNFLPFLKIKFVLAVGILGDIFLYITNLSSAIWHLPIITIFLLTYYFFVKIFKEAKGRVYGIYY